MARATQSIEHLTNLLVAVTATTDLIQEPCWIRCTISYFATPQVRVSTLLRRSSQPSRRAALGQFRLCRPGSGTAGQPNKRTPELEQTYLAIRHPPAG